jgi:hypothetical protein
MNGIKGNFYVSEEEYAAPSTLHEKGKSSDVMIYSNEQSYHCRTKNKRN